MALTFGETAGIVLRWLKGANLVSDIDEGFKTLASDCALKLMGYSQDTEAKRPAAGVANRVFKATDTGHLFHDTGAAWEALLVGSKGEAELTISVGKETSSTFTVSHGLALPPAVVLLTVKFQSAEQVIALHVTAVTATTFSVKAVRPGIEPSLVVQYSWVALY